jgi:hypothetical protein
MGTWCTFFEALNINFKNRSFTTLFHFPMGLLGGGKLV